MHGFLLTCQLEVLRDPDEVSGILLQRHLRREGLSGGHALGKGDPSWGHPLWEVVLGLVGVSSRHVEQL